MTLQQFNPKLNDIQNRPLVVLCSLLFMIIIYQIYDDKKDAERDMARERILQVTIDSMNREQIILYRDKVFGQREIQVLKEDIAGRDSLLKSKTKKSVIKILEAVK